MERGDDFLSNLERVCEVCVCVGYSRPKQERRGRERRKDLEVMFAWKNENAWMFEG